MLKIISCVVILSDCEKSLFLNFEIFRYAQYDKNSGYRLIFFMDFTSCYASANTFLLRKNRFAPAATP